ncbi:MAG: hypothetical protein IPN74_02510 [Haliscomenobacter sp.]|nr:hypothetical protein [Haliscomenobacter sp.]
MQSSVTGLFPPMAERTHVFSSITAEVVFGQSSKKCVGAGICRIIPYLGHRWSRITNSPCVSALGKLQKDEQGLSLVFRKYALCPTLRETFLSRSHFAMDEPFVFPAPLAEILGLFSAVIPAGKYPIRHQDGFIAIWLGEDNP